METVNDENQLILDEAFENEDVYVEKKTIYPIKAIAIIIASIIALGVIVGFWANAENKAHYAEQEQKLYHDADNIINDWLAGFESVTATKLLIGESQQTYAKSDLETDLSELSRYSALSRLSLDGIELEIEPDNTWSFVKDGEVVHEGNHTPGSLERS